MNKTFETWNFSPPLKNQIKVVNFIYNLIKNFDFPKKMIKFKKMNLYESKDLNLSSLKANKEIKWYTIMSQKEVIQYIVDWYSAYFRKKNMKIFSLKQIHFFYKLAKGKR